MPHAAQYFGLARSEEKSGNDAAALLLYLSSFCDSFNSGTQTYPIGATSKIRKLQNCLSLSDFQLLNMVRSYGPLTDQECQQLLYFSIHGNIAGIRTTLTGSAIEK